MERSTTAKGRPRRPVAALLLSLLAPGLGHVYCGRFGRGLVLFFVGSVLAPLGYVVFLPVASWFRAVAGAAGAVFLVVWVYAIHDAVRAARRIGAEYVLKEYNRWYVYVILVLLSVPIAVSLSLLVREGVIQAFRVPTRSMYPTIRQGERVLANKLAYRSEAMQRGDVVVFIAPNERFQKHIKRIVALPGDTVEITDGVLHINGNPLPRTPAGASEDEPNQPTAGAIFRETNGSARYRIFLAKLPGPATTDTQPKKLSDYARTVVPNGHVFALGDNRNQSRDSRHYGPVPMRDIVGRVDRIYYPRWVNLRSQAGD